MAWPPFRKIFGLSRRISAGKGLARCKGCLIPGSVVLNICRDKMDKMKTAALFDLDGVVLDTESQYSKFWGAQGRTYRPDIPHFDQVIKGQTLTQIFSRYFSDYPAAVLEKITAGLDDFEQHMEYNYIPGAREMLAWLQESGIPAALVTSSNDRKMQAVRRARPELEGYFSAWVTADKVTHSKPHPECFLLGAQLLGRGPGECVVFEDSFHGLAAGRAAGMTVVGLATTKSRAELEGRADLLIDDFSRLSPAVLWEEIGGLS